MVSLNKSLEDLVRMGEVTLEDAKKYSYRSRELSKNLR